MVTGGAGFIGTNLSDRLLERGETVRVFDDLSRPGVEENLRWLRSRHGDRVQHIDADIRDAEAVRSAVSGCSFVYHLAAQVAVTTSLQQPLQDHAINLAGTLNLLEAIRQSRSRPGLMFASTNKVYGALLDLPMRRIGDRWEPDHAVIRERGIDEQRPLRFISPYGCSKGAADQYVLDYCQSYGLAAVVLRMSCIYGPHQQANSDQGWVAHFLRSALGNQPLTIFGDGRQVRDVLYIDDFVAALLAVRRDLRRLSGQAFNMGGGVANTLSLLEMIRMAERLSGCPMNLSFSEPRMGDQLWFAADHRRFSEMTGWQPVTPPEHGVEQLWSWLLQSQRHAGTVALQQAGAVGSVPA
jgi:CDP-paratose 2-epimerase